MKCEKCGIELNGSTIVCRACKHNNAMQRVSAWKAKRAVAQVEGSVGTTATASPGRQPAQSVESETNLLQFPVLSEAKQQPRTAAGGASGTEAAALPPWRAQLKERVREARERRISGRTSDAGGVGKSGGKAGDPSHPNPIVAAALNRIQRAPATTTRPVRSSAVAAALVKEIEPDRAIKPIPEAKPAAKVPRPEPETVQTDPRARTPRNVTELKVKQESKNQTNQNVITPLARERSATTQPHPSFSERERDYRKSYSRPTIIRTRKHVKTQIIEIPQLLAEEEADQASDSPSLWVRTLAGACDFELIATGYLPIFAAYVSLNKSLGAEDSIILFILLAAITFLYQAVSLFIAERTCGMAVLRMRLVRNNDDQPISRAQKFIRALAATIAFLCPPLNILAMRLNGRRLSLPDLVSGTSPIEE
jgi:uncharacterized RDD family membrane protein YckC